MCANDSKVRSTSVASTFGHGAQPSGLILLSDALRHRHKILGVHPAAMILLDSRPGRADVSSRICQVVSADADKDSAVGKVSATNRPRLPQEH
jgi:hypothetical protein